MKVADIVYGCRYRVAKGFYRNNIGLALSVNKDATPPTVKMKLVQTTSSRAPLAVDMQKEVELDASDIEAMT